MIKLIKTELNKSAIMRELRKEAEIMYDNAYEREYAIEQFLKGAEALFKKLPKPDIVGQSKPLPTDEDLKNAIKKQLRDNGFRTD